MESTIPHDDGDGAEEASKPTRSRDGASPWRRLLYRWFVEYNPLYLVSALLVLGGVTLISRGFAEQSAAGQESGAVALIAEIYAAALIAGAALLTRIGHRRPAVMLAVLTAVYQCDLTLFTERSVYLGVAGELAVAAWVVVFIAKLYALAWATRLRLSRSAVGVAAFGALGVAVLPRYLSQAHSARVDAVVALWLFALFAAGLFTSRTVTSKVELDAWGRVVLARAAKTTWLLWAAAALFHAGFWGAEYRVSAGALLPVALLLATRWMRTEAAVWCATTATLLLVALVTPDSLSTAALMSGGALSLQALRRPTWTDHRVEEPRSRAPYRATRNGEPPAPTEASLGFARAPRDSMLRLLIGSISCLYLSAWTSGWSGGPLPEHVLALDAVLTAIAAALVWRARAWAVLGPVTAMYLHLAIQARLVTAPSSPGDWGRAAVGVGFGLLVGSLAISWRLRKVGDGSREDSPGHGGQPAGWTKLREREG